MLAYLNKIKLWIRNLLFCRSFNSLGIEFFFSLLFFWSRLKPSFTISIYLWMCMCVYLDSCNLACMLNWFQFIHVVILNAFLVCRPLSSRLKLFSFFFFWISEFCQSIQFDSSGVTVYCLYFVDVVVIVIRVYDYVVFNLRIVIQR